MVACDGSTCASTLEVICIRLDVKVSGFSNMSSSRMRISTEISCWSLVNVRFRSIASKSPSTHQHIHTYIIPIISNTIAEYHTQRSLTTGSPRFSVDPDSDFSTSPKHWTQNSNCYIYATFIFINLQCFISESNGCLCTMTRIVSQQLL